MCAGLQPAASCVNIYASICESHCAGWDHTQEQDSMACGGLRVGVCQPCRTWLAVFATGSCSASAWGLSMQTFTHCCCHHTHTYIYGTSSCIACRPARLMAARPPQEAQVWRSQLVGCERHACMCVRESVRHHAVMTPLNLQCSTQPSRCGLQCATLPSAACRLAGSAGTYSYVLTQRERASTGLAIAAWCHYDDDSVY